MADNQGGGLWMCHREVHGTGGIRLCRVRLVGDSRNEHRVEIIETDDECLLS
jgi:hypothetical protein